MIYCSGQGHPGPHRGADARAGRAGLPLSRSLAPFPSLSFLLISLFIRHARKHAHRRTRTHTHTSVSGFTHTQTHYDYYYDYCCCCCCCCCCCYFYFIHVIVRTRMHARVQIHEQCLRLRARCKLRVRLLTKATAASVANLQQVLLIIVLTNDDYFWELILLSLPPSPTCSRWAAFRKVRFDIWRQQLQRHYSQGDCSPLINNNDDRYNT